MLTSPKLIAPLQMALGIQPNLLRARTLPFLAHAFLRVLVGPQALEGRRAHRSAPRPLAELHARHQARLDEDGPLGRLAAAEGRVRTAERLELALHLGERRFREARAHLAGVEQLAVLVDARHDRSERLGPAALAWRPAADHHVLLADVLHLHPAGRAAAGLVGGVEPLRDDPLDPQVPRGGEQGAAVAAVVGGDAPGRALELERLEHLAALLVAERQRRAAVEIQQVEGDVGDGDVAHPAPHGRVRGEVHPALEALEAGPALLVERDDLPVEDHPPRAYGPGELPHLRVARREVAEVAALQLDVAVVAEHDRPDAVPLDLE